MTLIFLSVVTFVGASREGCFVSFGEKKRLKNTGNPFLNTCENCPVFSKSHFENANQGWSGPVIVAGDLLIF